MSSQPQFSSGETAAELAVDDITGARLARLLIAASTLARGAELPGFDMTVDHPDAASALIRNVLGEGQAGEQTIASIMAKLRERKHAASEVEQLIRAAATILGEARPELLAYEGRRAVVALFRREGGERVKGFHLEAEPAIEITPERPCARSSPSLAGLAGIYMPRKIVELDDDELPDGAIVPALTMLSRAPNVALHDRKARLEAMARPFLGRYGDRTFDCVMTALANPPEFIATHGTARRLREGCLLLATRYSRPLAMAVFRAVLQAGWNDSVLLLTDVLREQLAQEFADSPYGAPG